jgi:glycosyltransferase involved in cell wall biosynthesis
MKIVAVIPCLNGKRTIANIVTRCLQYVDLVIVVDDQSIDDTSDEARRAGAIICRTSGKRGAGKATWTGIEEAIGKGADVIITIDSDGQHDPEDIPKLLNEIGEGADAVITSRFINNRTKMPLYRKIGVWLITIAYNFNNKDIITDSQCCFRAFKSKVFDEIKIVEKGFGFSTELLIKLRYGGFLISEIPTHVIYFDDFSYNSSMDPIKHGMGVLMNTIKWRVKCELLSQSE